MFLLHNKPNKGGHIAMTMLVKFMIGMGKQANNDSPAFCGVGQQV